MKSIYETSNNFVALASLAIAIALFNFTEASLVQKILIGVFAAISFSAFFNSRSENEVSIWYKLFTLEPKIRNSDSVIITIHNNGSKNSPSFSGVLHEYFYKGDYLEKVILKNKECESDDKYTVIVFGSTDSTVLSVEYGCEKNT